MGDVSSEAYGNLKQAYFEAAELQENPKIRQRYLSSAISAGKKSLKLEIEENGQANPVTYESLAFIYLNHGKLKIDLNYFESAMKDYQKAIFYGNMAKEMGYSSKNLDTDLAIAIKKIDFLSKSIGPGKP